MMILNDACKLRRRKRTVVTVDAEGNGPLIYIIQQNERVKDTFTEFFFMTYNTGLFEQMNGAVVVQLLDYGGYQREHEQSQETEERNSDEHAHQGDYRVKSDLFSHNFRL